MILLSSVLNTVVKYVINTIDLVSEVPWEGKSMIVFYVDLVTGQSKSLVSDAMMLTLLLKISSS